MTHQGGGLFQSGIGKVLAACERERFSQWDCRPPRRIRAEVCVVFEPLAPCRIKVGASLVVGLPGPPRTKAGGWSHWGPRSITPGASAALELLGPPLHQGLGLRTFEGIGAPAA